MVVDLRLCTYFMLKIQRLALISRKSFLGDPSRFPFLMCHPYISGEANNRQGTQWTQGPKWWLALNQQIAVIFSYL